MNLNLLAYADFATDDTTYHDLVAGLRTLRFDVRVYLAHGQRSYAVRPIVRALGEAKGWHESRPIEEYCRIRRPEHRLAADVALRPCR